MAKEEIQASLIGDKKIYGTFGSEQGNVVTIHEVLFNVEKFKLYFKFDHLGLSLLL